MCTSRCYAACDLCTPHNHSHLLTFLSFLSLSFLFPRFTQTFLYHRIREALFVCFCHLFPLVCLALSLSMSFSNVPPLFCILSPSRLSLVLSLSPFSIILCYPRRDLKTSNLLLSNHGILKICDFGLARRYGDPIKPYTPTVVTLWYRAPELLLGAETYTPAIDMWSVGCIFVELLTLKPLFTGQGEMDQINKIFERLGSPDEKTWPDYPKMPYVTKFNFPRYP